MLDPKLKAEPITKETTLMSFDVESNGIHGAAFAVGAVLMKADETVLDEFRGRCPIRTEVDLWVKEHVLPALKNFPENYPNAKALRSGFWQWYEPAKPKANYVIVNNGYPIEARFLLACQEDDIKNRGSSHPYPLLELNSLLLQVGIKPLALKKSLVADKLIGQKEAHHHPHWDAWVCTLAAIKAFRLSGRLKD